MRGVNELYNAGDQVQIKKPLLKCHHGLNNDMRAMAGKVVTIEKVLSNSYTIKEDPAKWAWCDLCFDPIGQEPEGDISLEGLL